MDRLTPELKWLEILANDPLETWRDLAEKKAKDLAQSDPEDFKTLPTLLRQSVDSRKHGPRRSSTNQPRSK